MNEAISNELLDERIKQLQGYTAREFQSINTKLDVMIAVQERVVRVEAAVANSAEEKARLWVKVNEVDKKQDAHDRWANETREEIYGRIGATRDEFKQANSSMSVEIAGFRGRMWGTMWVLGGLGALFMAAGIAILGWLGSQIIDSTTANRLQDQRLQVIEANMRGNRIIESQQERK